MARTVMLSLGMANDPDVGALRDALQVWARHHDLSTTQALRRAVRLLLDLEVTDGV